jgi:serine/threonine protein phosphatase 1
LDFLADPRSYRAWRAYGAPETLLSYGVRPPRFDDIKEYAAAQEELAKALPPEHLRFLENSRLLYEDGDYVFVHAGIRPGLSLDRQRAEDLLWIRDDFLISDQLSDKIVVHGHSPTERPVRRSNRIGLDTGGYATGHLTAGVFACDEVNFITTEE